MVLFFFKLDLKGGVPHYFVLDKQKGLDVSEISAIVEQKNGVIWIGSENGLWQFDGFHFKQFKVSEKNKSPIVSNNITNLFIDDYDNLWIGYYQNGFSVWNLKTGLRRDFNGFINRNELKSERSMGFNKGPNNTIWAFFHDTAWLEVNPLNFTYKVIKPLIKGFFPIMFRSAKYVEQKKQWVVASSDGIAFYNAQNNEIKGKPYIINNKPVWKIHNSINGINIIGNQIFLNTWGGGITVFDILKDSFVASVQYNKSEQFSGATNNIFKAIPFRDSLLAISTSDRGFGFFNIKNNSFHFEVYDLSKKLNYANSMLFSKDSVFWVGFSSNLIVYNPKYQFTSKFDLPPSPNPTMVNLNYPYFLNLYKDRLITGSVQGRGVYTYDVNNFEKKTIFTFPYLKENQTFRSLQFIDIGKKILVNSWSGCFEIDLKNNIWKKFDFGGNVFLQNSVYRTVVKSRNFLLLGYADGRVGLFDLLTNDFKLWTSENVKNEVATFKGNQITDLILDVNNNIVAMHGGGMLVINPRTNELSQFSIELNKKHKSFFNNYHIVNDKNGMLWITSEKDGLLKINPNNKYRIETVVSEENGLPGNDIYDIEIDEKNNLWAIYGGNIIKVENKSNIVSCWNFKNGLQISPDDWSVLKIINNNLYYGVLNQWVKISINELESSQLKGDSIIITGFQHHFTQYFSNKLNEKYMLFDFEKSAFNLRVSLNHLINSFQTKFRYRVNNETEWQYLDQDNQIIIGNLPYGKYCLEVSYLNNMNNQWQMPQSILFFKIKHPFYLRWWFILLMILIIGSIFYLFYKIRIDKKQEVLDYEKKIDNLKLEVLRTQMNPHFIFNSLNSINYYIIKNQTENASNYLKKFSKLVRLFLNHSKSETVKLSEEIEVNLLYVEIEQMRFSKSFEIIYEKDPTIETEEIIVPCMLIQPFIENSIWHGLMHKSDAGVLKITLKKEEEYTIVVIEDNGIGRKKSAELKSKSATSNKSYGLEITNDRISIFNKLNPRSVISIETIDLFDNNMNSRGTRVSIKIHTNENQ